MIGMFRLANKYVVLHFVRVCIVNSNQITSIIVMIVGNITIDN